MNFPCRSNYESIQDGFELEIHLVDHCNLNCAGCNHYTPFADKYFINPKYFEDQLKLVKEKLPSIKVLILLGGEPTLHPQLLELCKIARNLFPDIHIEVLTNGINLEPIVNNKKQFKTLNIRFKLSKYTDINYNEELISDLVLDGILQKMHSRAFFVQPLVDLTGSQNAETQFKYKCIAKLPCLTLKDFKIYECPFAAHINNLKKFNINIPLVYEKDYLDLNIVTPEKLNNFCYTIKDICKYCRTGDYILRQASSFDINECLYNLQEYYLYDYKSYLNIINYTSADLSAIIDDRDPVFGINFSKYIKNRYTGKLDIIIPYYKLTETKLRELINSLNEQTIISNCMVYFISDASPSELTLIEILNTTKLNFTYTLLKNKLNSGPGIARNLGIENSYNKYIYFLDADDTFINNKVLENNWLDISKNNYNCLYIYKEVALNLKDAYDFLVSRDYLEKYSIRYGNFFVHEDLVFAFQLWAMTPLQKMKVNETQLGTYYTTDNKYRTSNVTDGKILVFNKIYAIYKCILFIEKYNTNIVNIQPLINIYSMLLEDSFITQYGKLTDDVFIKKIIICMYYLLMRFIQASKNIDTFINYLPKLTISESGQQILADITSNTISLKLNECELNTYIDYEQFFKNLIIDSRFSNKYFYAIFKDFQEELKNGKI